MENLFNSAHKSTNKPYRDNYDETFGGSNDLAVWHKELLSLAESRKLSWLISEDPEDHREAFEDGDTIEDEIENQIECIG